MATRDDVERVSPAVIVRGGDAMPEWSSVVVVIVYCTTYRYLSEIRNSDLSNLTHQEGEVRICPETSRPVVVVGLTCSTYGAVQRIYVVA